MIDRSSLNSRRICRRGNRRRRLIDECPPLYNRSQSINGSQVPGAEEGARGRWCVRPFRLRVRPVVLPPETPC